MRKYVYKNATVYITKPTEAQAENIRKATERFVKRLAREGLLKSDHNRRSDRRVGVNGAYAAQRNRKTSGKTK